MPTKTAPLGICDLCLGPTPTPYTSKGNPRRYCSVDCKNTANSRAGAEERGRKAKERVARGQWVNPASINPPTKEALAAGARRLRLREVEEGRWRNPGLTPEARAKNSEPHTHSGILADAIEKLRLSGGKMAVLNQEEADAYRAHARQQQKQHRASLSEDELAEKRRKERDYQRQRFANMGEEERGEARRKQRERKRRLRETRGKSKD